MKIITAAVKADRNRAGRGGNGGIKCPPHQTAIRFIANDSDDQMKYLSSIGSDKHPSQVFPQRGTGFGVSNQSWGSLIPERISKLFTPDRIVMPPHFLVYFFNANNTTNLYDLL